ncbi:unnamed protein product [Trichogramma brassicae]|uniref:Uncharacterized protein n=1 Tax=Trichogramma brassicae TaxID=86971 RepID=A0A6H5IBC5_9HYME|nr:unnamed protein product [Trichogramma brassicae]
MPRSLNNSYTYYRSSILRELCARRARAVNAQRERESRATSAASYPLLYSADVYRLVEISRLHHHHYHYCYIYIVEAAAAAVAVAAAIATAPCQAPCSPLLCTAAAAVACRSMLSRLTSSAAIPILSRSRPASLYIYIYTFFVVTYTYIHHDVRNPYVFDRCSRWLSPAKVQIKRFFYYATKSDESSVGENNRIARKLRYLFSTCLALACVCVPHCIYTWYTRTRHAAIEIASDAAARGWIAATSLYYGRGSVYAKSLSFLLIQSPVDFRPTATRFRRAQGYTYWPRVSTAAPSARWRYHELVEV